MKNENKQKSTERAKFKNTLFQTLNLNTQLPVLITAKYPQTALLRFLVEEWVEYTTNDLSQHRPTADTHILTDYSITRRMFDEKLFSKEHTYN